MFIKEVYDIVYAICTEKCYWIIGKNSRWHNKLFTKYDGNINKFIINESDIPFSFVYQFMEKIDWDLVSTHKWPEFNFCWNFKYNLNWVKINDLIIQNIGKLNDFMLKILKNNKQFIMMDRISMIKNITPEFIDKFSDYIHWGYINYGIKRKFYGKLNEQFLEKHLVQLDINALCQFCTLSKSFLEKNIKQVDLIYLEMNDEIDEELKTYIRNKKNQIQDESEALFNNIVESNFLDEL